MLQSKIAGHYSQAYDSQLHAVVMRVLEMCSLVKEQLDDALTAFVSGDVALAQRVVDMDRRVNTYEVDIDEHCIEILARRQPAASDLRLVLSILKMINDVERVGDLAENIARHAFPEGTERPNDAQLHDIREMGVRVKTMLHQALESFEKMDAADALNVLQQDKAIDSDYSRILRHNLTYMLEDPRQIGRSLEVIWVARSLERVGDHARNICQYSIFLSKGHNVSHSSDAEMQSIVGDKS